jgi:hypothetical protein
MTEPQTQNERSARIPLHEKMAMHIALALNDIKELQRDPAVVKLATVKEKLEELIVAVSATWGEDSHAYQSWKLDVQPDGACSLVLVPAPLPIPQLPAIKEG